MPRGMSLSLSRAVMSTVARVEGRMGSLPFEAVTLPEFFWEEGFEFSDGVGALIHGR